TASVRRHVSLSKPNMRPTLRRARRVARSTLSPASATHAHSTPVRTARRWRPPSIRTPSRHLIVASLARRWQRNLFELTDFRHGALHVIALSQRAPAIAHAFLERRQCRLVIVLRLQ